MKPPQGVFTKIIVNFIEGLPKSQGKSMIMVIVDMLTKFIHFIDLAHPYTANVVAQAFLDHVYKLHGLPGTMITGHK